MRHLKGNQLLPGMLFVSTVQMMCALRYDLKHKHLSAPLVEVQQKPLLLLNDHGPSLAYTTPHKFFEVLTPNGVYGGIIIPLNQSFEVYDADC